ncbi:MAG: DUF2807 domain-containing protein, partial [Cyclobacteriaceae bacterium]|nr:DUF2807 domain-containing protein [Cyclobacteriaceae bacterium]
TSLSVSEGIEVTISRGSDEKALVEASGIELSDVITEITGDRLKIHLANNLRVNHVRVRVYLTYRQLDELRASSAASLSSDEVLEAEDLRIDVSSAASIKLAIEVRKLDVNVSSAGDVELSGHANSQRVEVSSAGDYDASELESAMADVDVSSSGKAGVFVTEILEADASSAGKVIYRGNPSKMYGNSSSGGHIRKG